MVRFGGGKRRPTNPLTARAVSPNKWIQKPTGFRRARSQGAQLRGLMGSRAGLVRGHGYCQLCENSRGMARNRKAYNKPDKKLELINQRFYFWGAWEQYCFLLFFYTFLYYHHTTRLTPENELSRSVKVLTLFPMDEVDFERSMHSAATRLAQIPEASSLILCRACWV